MKNIMFTFKRLIAIFDSFNKGSQNYWNNYDHCESKRLELIRIPVKR